MQNWLKLLEIIGSKQEFEGAVKLHKIAYLAQSLGMAPSERFGWHLYGPYAHSLAARVEELNLMGAVEVESTDHPGAPDQFRLTPLGRQMLALLGAREGENAAVRQLARRLHDGWNREELEIAASIEFLVRNGRTGEQAIEELAELKPQFDQAAVRAAVGKLDLLREEVQASSKAE